MDVKHDSLNLSSNRHLFSRFRKHIRLWAMLVYLSFGVFDYLYSPENFFLWISSRIGVVVAIQVLFIGIVKSKAMRKQLPNLASFALCLCCWPIVFMMYQTGGYESLYSPGLILCGITGIQVFRMRNRRAMATLSACYLPAICVFFATVPREKFQLAIIQSGFLIGMIMLSYIYGLSEESVDRNWIRFKRIAETELHRLRQTEILKNHFPKVIRDMFEKNPGMIQSKKVLPNAVVGFADIVSSSQIANVIPLAIDWELKEKFIEAATRRAMESEMVVLSHLGDGFLFLANFNESYQWYYNLISFYEGLITDYKQIAKDLNLASTEIETGIKFGVSSGPVIVGFLGRNQSYFTAVGPDVNLAARLCSLAGPDQIVLSSRVWHSIKPLLIGWNFHSQTYEDIKGFGYVISAVHISPRKTSHADMICSQCAGSMSLIRTEDGFLDYRCPEGHNTPKLNPESVESGKDKKIA